MHNTVYFTHINLVSFLCDMGKQFVASYQGICCWLTTVQLKFEFKLKIYHEQPMGGSREGGGRGSGSPGKSQVAICFLRIFGTDPLEKELDPLLIGP